MQWDEIKEMGKGVNEEQGDGEKVPMNSTACNCFLATQIPFLLSLSSAGLHSKPQNSPDRLVTTLSVNHCHSSPKSIVMKSC